MLSPKRKPTDLSSRVRLANAAPDLPGPPACGHVLLMKACKSRCKRQHIRAHLQATYSVTGRAMT